MAAGRPDPGPEGARPGGGVAATPTNVLIFDGECGFCTWCAEWAERRLPAGAGTVPWQRVEDPAAYGLAREELAEAAYWIDGRRRPHRGHLAVAETLRAIGGLWGVLGDVVRAPVLSPLAAGVYELVARNRGRLPGTTPACRRSTWP